MFIDRRSAARMRAWTWCMGWQLIQLPVDRTAISFEILKCRRRGVFASFTFTSPNRHRAITLFFCLLVLELAPFEWNQMKTSSIYVIRCSKGKSLNSNSYCDRIAIIFFSRRTWRVCGTLKIVDHIYFAYNPINVWNIRIYFMTSLSLHIGLGTSFRVNDWRDRDRVKWCWRFIEFTSFTVRFFTVTHVACGREKLVCAVCVGRIFRSSFFSSSSCRTNILRTLFWLHSAHPQGGDYARSLAFKLPWFIELSTRKCFAPIVWPQNAFPRLRVRELKVNNMLSVCTTYTCTWANQPFCLLHWQTQKMNLEHRVANERYTRSLWTGANCSQKKEERKKRFQRR